MKTLSGETRAELLARRAELLKRLDAIKRDYANELDRDMEEQAIELENAEVLEALGRQALEQLDVINKKLERWARSNHTRH